MYEILFDVPLEPKFCFRPCLAPQILGSRKPHGSNPTKGKIWFHNLFNLEWNVKICFE